MIDYSKDHKTGIGARLEDGKVILSFNGTGLTQVRITKSQAAELMFKMDSLGIKSLFKRETC